MSKDKNKTFSASLFWQKTDGSTISSSHEVGVIRAVSKAEAIGIGLTHIIEKYPQSEGYRAHNVLCLEAIDEK